MSSYVLGLSCYYHDSAAALLKDGEIISAAQEKDSLGRSMILVFLRMQSFTA